MPPLNISPEELRFAQIFMPYAFERYLKVHSTDTRFVHYTSANSAMNILKTREVWMRKSSCMNDFMEVRHGVECLAAVYNSSDTGTRFKALMDKLAPQLRGEIEQLFNGWQPLFETDSYLTCISEHDSDEDDIGRLSMWRAYSEGTGVALVMKSAPFLTETDALQAYSSPVAYLSPKSFEMEFRKVVDNITAEFDFVQSHGVEDAKARIFHMLRLAVLCTKHPGFREEREWRIMHSPSYTKSERLVRSVEIIRGVPQPVYKIPLKDIPEEKLEGIEIPSLIDRIIIGPTQFSGAMFEAFSDLLKEAGVADPAKKIFVSNIPLRN